MTGENANHVAAVDAGQAGCRDNIFRRGLIHLLQDALRCGRAARHADSSMPAGAVPGKRLPPTPRLPAGRPHARLLAV